MGVPSFLPSFYPSSLLPFVLLYFYSSALLDIIRPRRPEFHSARSESQPPPPFAELAPCRAYLTLLYFSLLYPTSHTHPSSSIIPPTFPGSPQSLSARRRKTKNDITHRAGIPAASHRAVRGRQSQGFEHECDFFDHFFWGGGGRRTDEQIDR